MKGSLATGFTSVDDTVPSYSHFVVADCSGFRVAVVDFLATALLGASNSAEARGGGVSEVSLDSECSGSAA